MGVPLCVVCFMHDIIWWQVVHGPWVAIREAPRVDSKMLGGKRVGETVAVEWSLEVGERVFFAARRLRATHAR